MVVNSVLVRPPVTISDLQSVLANQSGDLATLIINSYINPWAKYKPVSYPILGILTDAQRQSVNYGIKDIPVWHGSSGTVGRMGNFWFGVNTTSTNYPECGFKNEYWAYQKPTGGSSSPYRLQDFAQSAGSLYGYKRDVNPPVGHCSGYSITISAEGYLTLPFIGQGSEQGDGYAVPLSELSVEGSSSIVFGNMYMSAMVRKDGSTTYYSASREYQWQSDNSTNVTSKVTKAVGEALEGRCETFPYLCATRQIQTISGEEYYTTPDAGTTATCVAMYVKSIINISIQYAQVEITNAYGYRWTASSSGDLNKYAYFILDLENAEEDHARSYTAEITLYNYNQVEQTATGTYQSGSINADGTATIVFKAYIADIWSSMSGGYFTAEVKLASTESVIFKRDSNWAMTQLLSDSPDVPR